MSLSQQFSVQCPVCNAEIVFYRVKRRFNCAACATTLGSNRSTVDVWVALIYLLLIPVLWVVAVRQLNLVDATSYVEWAVLAGAIGVAAYCVLVPRLLWLETDSWNRDAAPAPSGKKQKVLGYRSSAGAGPRTGEKKRAS
jgi:hypothetical protein